MVAVTEISLLIDNRKKHNITMSLGSSEQASGPSMSVG